MTPVDEAMNLARMAKAIDAENRYVPAHAALRVLAVEVRRLRGILSHVRDADRMQAEREWERSEE
jgi:hypothetical protein